MKLPKYWHEASRKKFPIWPTTMGRSQHLQHVNVFSNDVRKMHVGQRWISCWDLSPFSNLSHYYSQKLKNLKYFGSYMFWVNDMGTSRTVMWQSRVTHDTCQWCLRTSVSLSFTLPWACISYTLPATLLFRLRILEDLGYESCIEEDRILSVF